MTVRFLADEDIDVAIIQGLRSREPGIDILDAKTAGLRGAKDPALLELAAKQARIMVSHDRETMTRHFCERLAEGKSAPGLFIVPQRPSVVGEIIESILLVWLASQAEEAEPDCVSPVPVTGSSRAIGSDQRRLPFRTGTSARTASPGC